jgi:hypothetical protein
MVICKLRFENLTTMPVCQVSSVKASLANDELGDEPVHPVPLLLSSSEDVLAGDISGTIVPSL